MDLLKDIDWKKIHSKDIIVVNIPAQPDISMEDFDKKYYPEDNKRCYLDDALEGKISGDFYVGGAGYVFSGKRFLGYRELLYSPKTPFSARLLYNNFKNNKNTLVILEKVI